MTTRIASGIDRRDFERLLREAGGQARRVRRTGEVRYEHPSTSKRVVVNGRRKDVPRVAVTWLRRVLEEQP